MQIYSIFSINVCILKSNIILPYIVFIYPQTINSLLFAQSAL